MKKQLLNTYWLCKTAQDKNEGRRIETFIDLDSYDNINSFLKALHKTKEITDEELTDIMSVYYD